MSQRSAHRRFHQPAPDPLYTALKSFALGVVVGVLGCALALLWEVGHAESLMPLPRDEWHLMQRP